jgi:HlyD family secretion protein
MTVTRVIVLAACASAAAAVAADRYWGVVTGAGAEQRAAAAKSLATHHPEGVTALGRLQPDNGVIRVAGPSHPSVVIGQLFIDDGDPVRSGQTIAILDSYAATKANVAQLEAELQNAEAEWRRTRRCSAAASSQV